MENNENGRSMIEMLGVLAIIGVLSVGGIMGYSKAMFRYKVNKTIEQITYIAGNIRTTYANQGNYGGVGDNNILKKAHIIPDDMWKAGETYPKHAWEGNVWISSARKNSADTNYNKAFDIQYVDIPDEACIELITQDLTNLSVSLLEIEGDDVYYFKPPVAVDAATKACHAGGINVLCIYFRFEADTTASPWKNKIDATTDRLAGS